MNGQVTVGAMKSKSNYEGSGLGMVAEYKTNYDNAKYGEK
ncbi:hypothetical protein SCB49_02419 [unidentified eubacterium SCB49]|nr:hypothetical protein SCB49_02419 [unidentified eubacterium SCB49]